MDQPAIESDPKRIPVSRAANAQLQEAPETAIRAALEQVAAYTIGFVQIGGSGRKLLGSGTLITIDGRRVILTSNLVLEQLPVTGRLGLVLRTHLNQISVDVADLTYRSRPAELTSSDAPDLGTVLLSAPVAERISGYNRFYDLPAKPQRVASTVSQPQSGFWCLNGFVNELTTTELPLDCFDMIRGYTNIGGIAEPLPTHGSAQFAFTRFGIPSGVPTLEGMSGAGLWWVDESRAAAGRSAALTPALSGAVSMQLENLGAPTLFQCHEWMSDDRDLMQS
ncbi:MAG: hypothetical protein ACKVVP_22600 [Chloroflexota bacterium]